MIDLVEIVRTTKEFLNVVKESPRDAIIIFDDAYIIPDNSKYLKAIEKEIAKAMNNKKFYFEKKLAEKLI